MAKKPRVFISYSRQDNQGEGGYHIRLRDHIQNKLGISDVWMDLNIPSGTPWADVIDQELEKSTHLVLIWTPNAAYSENVTYEWTVAFLMGLPILPIQSPEYAEFRPSEIPAILAELNFISDPTEMSGENAKLNRGFFEGAAGSPHTDVPIKHIRQLRSVDSAGWQESVDHLKKWAEECTSTESLAKTDWVLEKCVLRNAPKPQREHVEAVRRILARRIHDVELHINYDSIRKLRGSLTETALDLQKLNVPGEVIQSAVKRQVEAWSLAQYGTARPPAPELRPGDYFSQHERKCGWCKLQHQPDEVGCCTDCGLFYSWWEDHPDESASKPEGKPKDQS